VQISSDAISLRPLDVSECACRESDPAFPASPPCCGRLGRRTVPLVPKRDPFLSVPHACIYPLCIKSGCSGHHAGKENFMVRVRTHCSGVSSYLWATMCCPYCLRSSGVRRLLLLLLGSLHKTHSYLPSGNSIPSWFNNSSRL